MTTERRQLVCMITKGCDHELSSIGFTIANGGITAGLDVAVFLVSAGVDLVRKGAAEGVHTRPFEPLAELIRSFLVRGGTIWACTPCVKARGYGEGDLLDGVIVSGASVVHERIKNGAATLSF